MDAFKRDLRPLEALGIHWYRLRALGGLERAYGSVKVYARVCFGWTLGSFGFTLGLPWVYLEVDARLRLGL